MQTRLRPIDLCLVIVVVDAWCVWSCLSNRWIVNQESEEQYLVPALLGLMQRVLDSNKKVVDYYTVQLREMYVVQTCSRGISCRCEV